MVTLTWKINVLVLYNYYNYVEIFAICCHKFGKKFYYANFCPVLKIASIVPLLH